MEGKGRSFLIKKKPGRMDLPGLGIFGKGGRMPPLLGLHHAAHAAVVMAVAACTGCFLFRKIGDEGFGGE
jgi:hypothetical protein